MKKKIVNFIKKILPQKLFFELLIIYQAIKLRSLKYIFYKTKYDLEYNESNFEKLGFEIKKIKIILQNTNLDYFNPKLSWHYHIFAGLQSLEKKKGGGRIDNILEIGTHDGNFTNFLSKIFKLSKITTIDLKKNSKDFINSYNRNNNNYLKKFLEKRNYNLKNSNIIFKEMNSFDLLEHYNKSYFDLIFLDGDHTNPQVSMDVLSAFFLLKRGGILICDDIYINKKDNRFNEKSDGYEPVKYLDSINKTKSIYFVKRVFRHNSYTKKYISYSLKI
jgi:hypothetical protein